VTKGALPKCACGRTLPRLYIGNRFFVHAVALGNSQQSARRSKRIVARKALEKANPRCIRDPRTCRGAKRLPIASRTGDQGQGVKGYCSPSP